MKKFTVKDFIAYNNPCFSCGKNIELKVSFTDPQDIDHFLRPTVNAECVEVDLHIRYVSTLKLKIYHKNNKIWSSDKKLLREYLSDRRIVLTSECKSCGTSVRSQSLQFDLDKSIVQAFSLSRELLMLFERGYQYRVATSFEQEATEIAAIKIIGSNPDTTPPIKMTLPILPISKIKDRQSLISKLRTYITFS